MLHLGAGSSGAALQVQLQRNVGTYSLDAGFPVAINDTSSRDTRHRQGLYGHAVGDLGAGRRRQDRAHERRRPDVDGASNAAEFRRDRSDGRRRLVGGRLRGNKIGIMWSNQTDSAMYFSIHADGAPDGSWTVSRNAVPGPNFADDHINLKSLQADTSGRVFAAVKSSLDDVPNPNPNAPLTMLLVRDPATGDWSNFVFGKVADHHTRPIVMLDAEHQVIHMFATAPTTAGAIYEKTSPLDSIAFAPGLGTRVLTDPNSLDMNNATSTKQNVNSTTGLVILASNDTTQPTTSYPSPTGGFYWHAYRSLASP